MRSNRAGIEDWTGIADNFREESIAFALATGIAPIFSLADQDADIERSARRERWQRRKAQR